MVGVNNTNATLSVIGENVVIRNIGGGYGLSVNAPQSVQLSAETYSGGTNAISCSGYIITIRQLLATDCAYYDKDGKLFTGGLVNTSLHAVTVTVDGEELGAANYDVTYANNTKAGNATVTISSARFGGKFTKTFSIAPAALTITATTRPSPTAGASPRV